MEIAKGDQKIAKQIIEIRESKVLLDFQLAQLYLIETRVLKQQVKRNIDRFPADFMIELHKTEIELLVSQNVIPNKGVLGGATPMAFSEQGVAMLSSVLNSKKAVEANIAIIRTFVHLRRILQDNDALAGKIKRLEKKYDEKFQVVFNAIKDLIQNKDTPRKPIGYKPRKKE